MRARVGTLKMLPSFASTISWTLFAPPNVPAYLLWIWMNGWVCGRRAPKLVSSLSWKDQEANNGVTARTTIMIGGRYAVRDGVAVVDHPLTQPVECSLVLLFGRACAHATLLGSALHRQPALAAVFGVVDEPESADHPAVLRVGEADGPEPGENVLADVGPVPDAGAGLRLHHLARRPDGPGGAVRELDHVVQRVDQLHVAAVGLVVGPLVAAVARAGDVRLEPGRHRVLTVLGVEAEERREVE